MPESLRVRNPFRPGAGARPPVLAGRDSELARARRALDRLEAGAPPSQGMLFFGPRGNGKTVLLATIAEEAAERGMRVGSVLPWALQTELAEAAGSAEGPVNGVRETGVGESRAPAFPLTDLGQLLAAWITAEPSPLVILFDEAHTVEPEAGNDFFDAIQQATIHGLPFWLLAAGTPDAPRRIHQAAGFTQRMFEEVPVGRLDRDATLRALREPATDGGLPFDDGAAALLADESRDYPYFVQLLGKAAWDAAVSANERGITPSSARSAIAALEEEIALFFSERFDEAHEHGIEGILIPLAAAIRDRGGQLGELEIDPLLEMLAASQSLSGGDAALLSTLTDLGILWDERPGLWEPGIPSFMDYLLALPGA